MIETVDAVLIGAGPQGLVAVAVPAEAGWDVLLLEASRPTHRQGRRTH